MKTIEVLELRVYKQKYSEMSIEGLDKEREALTSQAQMIERKLVAIHQQKQILRSANHE